MDRRFLAVMLGRAKHLLQHTSFIIDVERDYDDDRRGFGSSSDMCRISNHKIAVALESATAS